MCKSYESKMSEIFFFFFIGQMLILEFIFFFPFLFIFFFSNHFFPTLIKFCLVYVASCVSSVSCWLRSSSAVICFLTRNWRQPLANWWASLAAQTVKDLSANQETQFLSIPGSGRFPGEGIGDPPQYFCVKLLQLYLGTSTEVWPRDHDWSLTEDQAKSHPEVRSTEPVWDDKCIFICLFCC